MQDPYLTSSMNFSSFSCTGKSSNLHIMHNRSLLSTVLSSTPIHRAPPSLLHPAPEELLLGLHLGPVPPQHARHHLVVPVVPAASQVIPITAVITITMSIPIPKPIIDISNTTTTTTRTTDLCMASSVMLSFTEAATRGEQGEASLTERVRIHNQLLWIGEEGRTKLL